MDARADAYGHGIALIAPAARAAGVARLVVSDERDAAVARAYGLEALVDRQHDAAGTAAYGLDGEHRPVMTLEAELIAVKRVPAGSGVSYGYTYRTTTPTTLGLVGLGYADGVPRLASNRAMLSIEGARFPLVGRIAMDQLVIDLGDALVRAGTPVVVFGDPGRGEPSALEWAAWTERDPLALTAGLGPRIHREAR